MLQGWQEVTDPALSIHIRELRRQWLKENPRRKPRDFQVSSGYTHFRVKMDGTVEFHTPVGRTLGSAITVRSKFLPAT